MKNIQYFIIPLISLAASTTQAGTVLDSLSYEAQRSRVNQLLDERALKFGEYDNSLTQKTGIFGLFKTTHDMQRSINILREIVQTDNKIFVETRQLLTIKDNQAEKYERLANEYDAQVTAYMKTISKLQTSNEKLQQEIEAHETDDHSDRKIYFTFSIIIIGLLSVIFIQFKRLKSQKVTQV